MFVTKRRPFLGPPRVVCGTSRFHRFHARVGRGFWAGVPYSTPITPVHPLGPSGRLAIRIGTRSESFIPFLHVVPGTVRLWNLGDYTRFHVMGATVSPIPLGSASFVLRLLSFVFCLLSAAPSPSGLGRQFVVFPLCDLRPRLTLDRHPAVWYTGPTPQTVDF